MLFSSSTDVYSGITEVFTETFSGLSGFFIFIIGVIIAFWVIEILLKAFYPNNFKDSNTEV